MAWHSLCNYLLLPLFVTEAGLKHGSSGGAGAGSSEATSGAGAGAGSSEATSGVGAGSYEATSGGGAGAGSSEATSGGGAGAGAGSSKTTSGVASIPEDVHPLSPFAKILVNFRLEVTMLPILPCRQVWNPRIYCRRSQCCYQEQLWWNWTGRVWCSL